MYGWIQRSAPPELDRIPSWFWLSTIILPVGFFVVGYFGPIESTVENFRSLLMVLGGALATILAIVFSVTILGMQLIATRYTARGTSLFVEHPVFKFTFGLFALGIGTNVLGLVLLPSSLTKFTTSLVLSIVGISLLPILLLYSFIGFSAELNTPEGFLNAVETRLRPDRYRHKVKQHLKRTEEYPHPLHAVYGMVLSAMANREPGTAEDAINTMQSVCLATLHDLSDEDSTTDRDIKQLFEPIVGEYLPEIALSAAENGNDSVMRRALSAHKDIALQGVETTDEFVAEMALEGLWDLFIEVETEDNSSYLLLRVAKQASNIIKTIAQKPARRTTRYQLSRFSNRIDRYFREGLSDWAYREFTRQFHDDFLVLQSALLDNYGHSSVDHDIDWRSKGIHGSPDNRESAECINAAQETLITVTNHWLNYAWENRDQEVRPPVFRSDWGDICTQAAKSPLTEYAIAQAQLMIETAYCYYLHDPAKPSGWAREVAEVKRDADPAVVEAAFARIRSESGYNRRIQPRHNNYTFEQPPLHQRILQKIASPQSLDEWAVEFEETVDERYAKLIESE